MNLITLGVIVNIIIIFVSTWAVLSPKVKTNSFCIFGLSLMNIGSAVGIDEVMRGILLSHSALLIRCGVALLCLIYFLGVEVTPRLFSTARRS